MLASTETNPSKSPNFEGRAIIGRIKEFLAADASLGPRYEAAKATVRHFRKPAYYEVSQRCNLWCEGCFYFENEGRLKVENEPVLSDWDAFYKAEAERGVSMAYFVGAEPALEWRRLLAASKYLPIGNIGTNGTIKLHPDLRYRIQVSVWGDEKAEAELRGGSVMRKALRNYEGDDRALMLLTLMPWNLHTVPEVLRACRDHGLPASFNMFSPTVDYLKKINAGQSADGQFFRLAPERGAPSFSDDDLRRVSDTLTQAMEDFPDTVLCSPKFRDKITTPGPMFPIDPETGIADGCRSRIVGDFRYYAADLTSRSIKCCTPNVDCSECRLYSGAWSTILIPENGYLQSKETFASWLDMMETLARIHVYAPAKAQSSASTLSA